MKEFLLAKSNIRKAKGLTIGLILLLILATCFLNIVLIVFTDFNSNSKEIAKKLNSEDAYIMLRGDISNVNENYVKALINNDVEDYEIDRQISSVCSTPYGNGTVVPLVTFAKEKQAFNCKIGKNEVIEEDDSIKNNYVYLPYQYHTGGNFNVGDNFELKLLDKEYNLKIKGFINNMMMGSYNSGTIQLIVSDNIYNEILENSEMPLENIIVKFDLKDNVNGTKFINKFVDEVLNEYPTIETDVGVLDNAIFTRTFISLIFGISFLVISLIIIVIVMLMLSNNISNYIKENIKTLGAIKALGYTNKEIKISFLIQFFIIAGVGCLFGIILSYMLLPAITNIMISQAGIPYTITFNVVDVLITVVCVILIVILTVLFFLRKTNKIQPIVALREGIKTHNFRKNRIKLESSKFSLNVSLALKTTFFNIKQNIATFAITFFLVFIGIVGLAMYQNFSVNPKISLLTFEICSGAIMTDSDTDGEVYKYLDSLEETKNVRLVTNIMFNVDDARVMTYILDDMDKLNNKDICYKGRLPKYDNEIALSGRLCKDYNYNIGDEVEFSKGNSKEKYLITGFIQTTNNNGQEGVILQKGAEKVLGNDYNKMYYFDSDEDVDVAKCIEKIQAHLGDKVVTTVNFEEVFEGSIAIFKVIANSMAILVLVISALVILLVLYLLIKTLINNKRKDYGILKAVGYTSKDIIMQNAISFMPTIILSVVISCIVSSFLVNPYLGIIMSIFGIMKLTLDIPVGLIICMGIGFIVVSFVFAVLLSRKVKKIEPYKLLTEE